MIRYYSNHIFVSTYQGSNNVIAFGVMEHNGASPPTNEEFYIYTSTEIISILDLKPTSTSALTALFYD